MTTAVGERHAILIPASWRCYQRALRLDDLVNRAFLRMMEHPTDERRSTYRHVQRLADAAWETAEAMRADEIG